MDFMGVWGRGKIGEVGLFVFKDGFLMSRIFWVYIFV